MSIIHQTRVLLIRIGKALPFVFCFLVLVSFFEDLLALLTEDYLYYEGYYVLNKPISWFIGTYFEYNITHLVVISIISIAIETCIFNKIACGYLGLNLYEKSYFAEHIYDNEVYYIVSIINIAICAYLCYKGIKILLK